MARMATLSRSERDAAALREPLDCQTEAPKRGVCPRDNRIAAAPVLVAHCCFGAAGRGSGGLAAQLVERQRSCRLAPCAGVSRCVPGQEWGSRARRVGAVRASDRVRASAQIGINLNPGWMFDGCGKRVSNMAGRYCGDSSAGRLRRLGQLKSSDVGVRLLVCAGSPRPALRGAR